MSGDIIRRTGLARVIAGILMIGAVLPGITYLDHMHTETAHTHSSAPSRSEGEEHVLHCHTGGSSCAGAQALVGAIWVGEDPGLIAPGQQTSASRENTPLITPEAPVIGILDPPRAA